MSKETTPIITSLETKSRKLAYVNEFGDMLRSPGIIKTAIELTDKAIAEYNPPNVMVGDKELRYERESGKWLQQKENEVLRYGKVVKIPYLAPMEFDRYTILSPAAPIVDEITGLEVSVIGRSNREMAGIDSARLDKCDYLKMTMNGESFFVKRSFITINPGFTEFQNTISAKELLKDLDFVKVVDTQLGYQDKKESWYVSKWEDFQTDKFGPHNRNFDDYGTLISVSPDAKGWFKNSSSHGFASKEEFKDVQRKVKQIEGRLMTANIHHDLRGNLFYSRKTKTFVLLDVTGDDTGKMLGDPIRR